MGNALSDPCRRSKPLVVGPRPRREEEARKGCGGRGLTRGVRRRLPRRWVVFSSHRWSAALRWDPSVMRSGPIGVWRWSGQRTHGPRTPPSPPLLHTTTTAIPMGRHGGVGAGAPPPAPDPGTTAPTPTTPTVSPRLPLPFHRRVRHRLRSRWCLGIPFASPGCPSAALVGLAGHEARCWWGFPKADYDWSGTPRKWGGSPGGPPTPMESGDRGRLWVPLRWPAAMPPRALEAVAGGLPPHRRSRPRRSRRRPHRRVLSPAPPRSILAIPSYSEKAGGCGRQRPPPRVVVVVVVEG